MSWVDAIKKYAEKNNGNYLIPKRDTPEYAEIKKIQEALANSAAEPAKKVRAKPVKTANVVEKKIEEPKEVPHKKVAPPVGEKVANVVPKEKKMAKVKVLEVPVLPDGAPKRKSKAKAKVEEAPVVEEKPKRKYTKKAEKMKIVNEPVTMVFN